jgi:hypothetical protein
MRRTEAKRKNAKAFRLRHSQFLAKRRQQLSHAMVRSTIIAWARPQCTITVLRFTAVWAPAESSSPERNPGPESLELRNYSALPYHHRQGPFGEAVHNGTKFFETKYGCQRDMLEVVLSLI